jgi:hypothetical protein
MDIASFESRIKDLDQQEILAGAISSLNKLLVDKGVLRQDEIQEYFLQWMDESKLPKKKSTRKKTR